MSSSFDALGVPAELVSTLKARGIDAPFPIQALTVADGLAGRDVSGRAPTGSGKTLAFGIPIVARVERAAARRPRALVLVPTRELASQVAGELEWLGRVRKLRVATVFGGTGYGLQIKALRKGVDVLVACPGRLGDLIERNEVVLDQVQIVVVDEADRMADMGFLPVVKKLLDRTPENRQTLLFSATLDGAVDALVRRYQRDPARHILPEDEEARTLATHAFWRVEREDRVQVCVDVIKHAGPTIVFCRTKRGTDQLAKKLAQAGIRNEAIHGNRSQSQRERALAAFTHGRVDALIATDVAARGIHVDDVACVVHFDPPHDAKDYTHRSGRTARAGSRGTVISLIGRDQTRDALQVQRELDLHVGIDKPTSAALATLTPAAVQARASGPVVAVSTSTSTPTSIGTGGESPQGTIKWFDTRKGFGFIDRGREKDLFVHCSAFESDGSVKPQEGQRVEFEIAPGRRGEQASKVRVLAS
jgi:superfamily II DNA/RNA helicase/cold shock CspA family protein